MTEIDPRGVHSPGVLICPENGGKMENVKRKERIT